MPTVRRFRPRHQQGSPVAEALARGAAIVHTPETEREVRQIFANGIDNQVGGRVAPYLCNFAKQQLIAWGLPDPSGPEAT